VFSVDDEIIRISLNNIEDQSIILKKIEQLAIADSDIEVLWLYGSRANECYHVESDFDLAIAFKNFDLSINDKYLRPNILAMQWAASLGIAESKLSIIDINMSPVYLTFNVIEYGDVLYETPSMRRISEVNRIYSQYEFQMIESQKNA
jgi:predicted nucleotidyltransferase